eukprot:270249-Pleurochrysis_carterae.AAC.1
MALHGPELCVGLLVFVVELRPKWRGGLVSPPRDVSKGRRPHHLPPPPFQPLARPSVQQPTSALPDARANVFRQT